MTDELNNDSSGVDKGLIAMFLKLTPEERLRANDNAVRAIFELRNGYQRPPEEKLKSIMKKEIRELKKTMSKE